MGIFVGRCAGFLLATSLLLATSSVRAQSEEELARARQLFNEGVEFTRQERWDDAVDRFRQVLEVRDTAQVRYNLALALERSGHLLEALRLLNQVMQDASLDRRMRREAANLVQSIPGRVGRLTVELEGDAEAVAVTVDEHEVSSERIGSPIVVDPGTHSVVVRRHSTLIDRRSVEVPEGQTTVVTMRTTMSAPTRVELDPELLETRNRDADTSASGQGDVTQQWWFWTVIAVGVLAIAGVAIGLGVGLSGGEAQPVPGDLMPGVIEVTLP